MVEPHGPDNQRAQSPSFWIPSTHPSHYLHCLINSTLTLCLGVTVNPPSDVQSLPFLGEVEGRGRGRFGTLHNEPPWLEPGWERDSHVL